MRIAYMLTSLGVGGAERQVIALGERMAARGHEVVLIVLRPRLADEWHTRLGVVRLHMTRSPAGLGGGFIRGGRFLRSFRPDIVHSHTFPANMAARVFRAMGAAPVVVSTIHNVYEGGRRRTIAYRLTDPFCLHSTAVSRAVADRYCETGAVARHKCSVITNGFDLDEFSPHAPNCAQERESRRASDDFVWLAAGRDVPAKDFDNLLAAFRQVRAEIPGTQLWIAGRLEEQRLVRINCRVVGTERNESEGVRWLGFRDDMPEVLAASNAFVLSSAWEGLPLVVGEAMAMEKPVVATDVGGVKELVGDAGVLVQAKTPEALAKAMLRVMRMERADRLAMGKAARLRIGQHFDVNAKATEWEALYGRLLGDHRQRSSGSSVIP
jgi:glycosyltransferase involved in cell wall biosynthesis